MDSTNEQAKKEYDSFSTSEDFKLLFPSMTGNWEKDKKKWIVIWKENQKFINGSTKNFNND